MSFWDYLAGVAHHSHT